MRSEPNLYPIGSTSKGYMANLAFSAKNNGLTILSLENAGFDDIKGFIRKNIPVLAFNYFGINLLVGYDESLGAVAGYSDPGWHSWSEYPVDELLRQSKLMYMAATV